MPVGTAELVAGIVAEHAPQDAAYAVVSNPEFLREGRVVHDILHPDRVVLGGDDPDALAEIPPSTNRLAPRFCGLIIVRLN